MKLAATLCLCAAGLTAQTMPKNPIVATSQAVYAIAKGDVLKSMDKIPDAVWSYKPTPDVRTVGQLFAHIADGQYEFCGPVKGESVDKGVEKTAKTKAEITAAVKDAFGYCDAIYAKMTDADAAVMVKFFNMNSTKVGLLDFNTAHVMEHYGNLVTYMRMKGIVPPSSESQK
jgi:uncharacterized damage-inducible protein DinB